MYRISIFLFLLLSYSSSLCAQATFDPKDGDRVIFLGNALMENEQQYGFLEYLISSNHPEKHLSFRNLGWSGDTVFGDARSYYTSPPGPFDLLISQIKATRADWAFVAYGAVEAQNGSKGLDEFEQGLSRLLDSLEAMGTKALIISTIPQLLMNGAEQSDQHISNLKAYNQSMSRIAEETNLAFIDVFGPIEREQSDDIWESNRVHLNQNGYLLFTQTMGEKMGLKLSPSDILINIKTNTLTSDHQAELLAAEPGKGQRVKDNCNSH